MKVVAPIFMLFMGTAMAEEASPIGMVLELISNLQAKVIAEGEKSQKIYEEFSEWCEETNKNLMAEIKTAKAEIKDLNACIDEETALIESLTTKVEELSAKLKVDEQDLKAATHIRDGEAAIFAEEKAELDDIISTLERAIGILEKSPNTALLQEKGAGTLTKALSLMVGAAGFSGEDASRLSALVQESQEDFDADDGAPDAAVYEGHSSGIIETLQGLLDKAETQLQNLQNRETKALFEYKQLKQSIEDAIAYGEKELAEAKKGINQSGEKKATAEGDLDVTTKDQNEDSKKLDELHTDCMTKAEDFEAEVKSRAEELAALAQAKKVLKETTGAAGENAYGLAQEQNKDQADSFVQMKARSGHFQAVHFVRDLARKMKAPALAQLASRMATALREGSGEDVFAKVKGLIANMIERLEAEAQADAKHKAYCDKELKYANKKKADRDAEIEKLTTSIDQMTAKSAQLKEEVAMLQKELMDIAKSQAEMDKLRQEEKDKFEEEKAEFELGLRGVKKALKVLRDYYSKADDADHAVNEGGGTSIIGLLEVVESDFEKGLSEAVSEEESSVAEYERLTKENEITTTKKEQDVKFKNKESKDLDKAVAEATSDKENVQSELDAVEEYLSKLHEECDEKVEPYEEAVRRRTAEIAGLKQALEILEGETASLLQMSSTHQLRKVSKHIAT